MTDPRVTELEELAESEGFRLPMPPRMILFFEDNGCTVDLVTGIATRTHPDTQRQGYQPPTGP